MDRAGTASAAPSGREHGRKGGALRKVGILGASLLVTLLACEVGARIAAHRHNRDTLEVAMSRPQDLEPGGEATLRQIIRVSENDKIAFELQPDLSGILFKGKPLTTDSHGFRTRGPGAPPLELAPLPEGTTIVGIGDSILFGHGVGDGDGYLEQLGGLLAARHPEHPWRVVNSGVPGYNTVMEVETLEKKLLVLEPDLVVLGICSNDYAPPQYVRIADDVLDPTRSFFLEFVKGRLAADDLAGERAPDLPDEVPVGAEQGPGKSTEKSAAKQVDGLLFNASWQDILGGDPEPQQVAPDASAGDEAVPRYRDLRGPKFFDAALDRLRELSEQHGFEVLAFATVDYKRTPEMMAACAKRGFTTVHLQPKLDEALGRAEGAPFDLDQYAKSNLVVAPSNLHPSVLQHRMAADLLYETLEESGWLARWTAVR